MRAAPACQFTVRRFGVWRAAVGTLGLLAAAAIVAWLVAHERPIAPSLWIGAAIGALIVALAIAGAARQRPVELRWDGRQWHLVDASSAAPRTGSVGVALDLGHWMLLRFEPTGSRRTVWLPVQRRGLEASWHALRCAVCVALPAPDDTAIGGH